MTDSTAYTPDAKLMRVANRERSDAILKAIRSVVSRLRATLGGSSEDSRQSA